ncbi:DUF2206 domain-containing protein [Haloplanus pelagicus]|uniref:DUF2206 domain-containing protein n=1 Tax=Haloplanus pelagicus TaxID=2949995 RepID=UPI00203F22EA|nr:DUF2206 domain-containing protein [Haloplanus sp. HW8-1]
MEHLAIAVTVLFGAIALLDETLVELPLVRPVVGFVFLTFATGGVVLTALGFEPSVRARSLIYTVGVGLMSVMLIGLVLNAGFLQLGLADPLSPLPLVVALSLSTIGIAVATLWYRSGPTVDDLAPDPARVCGLLREDGLQVGLVLLLPVAGVLSVVYLNGTNEAAPLLVVLAAVASVPLFAVMGFVDERYLAFAAWGTGLTILYHKTVWVGSVYGGHASTVGVYEQHVWTMSGETLLPNAVLMPAYAHVLDVGIITQTQIVMPAMVAFIPPALYVTFRDYTSPSLGYLGAAIFMFAHPFYYQYPSTPRASIPVLFLVLIGTVMSDTGTAPIVRRSLALLFAAGLAVSHYGTSYYALFALGGALLVLVQFRLFDRVAESIAAKRAVADGSGSEDGLLSRVPPNLLRLDFVAFYAIVVTAWYYYIDRSSKFVSIAEHVVSSFAGLFESGGGATATRLSTDYGGLSIRYSKYVYLIVASLSGFGLALAFVRRYVPALRTEFSDEYLATTALLFVLFGGTFIMSGQWGGGRPMMIVLSFSAVFTAVAANECGRAIAAGCEAGARRISGRLAAAVDRAPTLLGGKVALATVLAVFFLLNSGFMAAVAYGGEAPSNVPQSDTDDVYTTYDIETHVWLADHRDVNYPISGDRNARAQTTDWMNGEIAARSERSPYRFRKSSQFTSVNDSELGRGYLLLMGHNVEEDRAVVNYVVSRPMSAYDLETDRRHRVYSNGAGRVYFVGNDTRTFTGGEAT